MLVFWPLEIGIIEYFDFGAMHFANGVMYGVYTRHTCLINCSYEQSAIINKLINKSSAQIS